MSLARRVFCVRIALHSIRVVTGAGLLTIAGNATVQEICDVAGAYSTVMFILYIRVLAVTLRSFTACRYEGWWSRSYCAITRFPLCPVIRNKVAKHPYREKHYR